MSLPHLLLYSRPECHLCERVLEQLQPLVHGRATVEIVDIDGDETLERRYGLRIPVLVCGAEELSGYPLDRANVERFLAGG